MLRSRPNPVLTSPSSKDYRRSSSRKVWDARLLTLTDADSLIEKAVSAAGVSHEELKQTAQLLARSISPVILFGKGITAQRDETLVEELYNLAVLVGAVDSERHGLISVKGESNSLTATLLGLDTDLQSERTTSCLRCRRRWLCFQITDGANFQSALSGSASLLRIQTDREGRCCPARHHLGRTGRSLHQPGRTNSNSTEIDQCT